MLDIEKSERGRQGAAEGRRRLGRAGREAESCWGGGRAARSCLRARQKAREASESPSVGIGAVVAWWWAQ
eukprot:5732530-Pleurochrysis_carterae.AAC.2